MLNTASDDVPQVTLGWRLRMSLEHAGIEIGEMAARLDVHRGTITRWAHDVGRPPRLVYLEKWAEITGVRLDWLRGSDNNGSLPDNDGYLPFLACAAA